MENQDLPQEGMQPVEVVLPHVEEEPVLPDAVKPPVKESPKESYVSVKISRKAIWGWSFMVVIIVAGIVSWKMNVFRKLLNNYNMASITLKVTSDTKDVLQGAQVQINGTTYTSNTNGDVAVTNIIAGTYTATVSKDGYVTAHDSIVIYRGDNAQEALSIAKVATPLYTLTGVANDYITGGVLENVKVVINNTTVITDPSGSFSFPKLVAGSYSVAMSKAGFIDKQDTITLKANNSVATEALVPNGQVVFVSNRDGKRALYVSNYDGSNQHQLVAPANGGEDFAPLVSPNGQWIVFSSTRDGNKTTYGAPAATLYLASADGKALKEISTNVAATKVHWSPDSSSIYYEAYSDLAISQYVRHFYTIATGATFDLGIGDNVVYNAKGNLVAYTTTNSGQVALMTLNISTGTRTQVVTQAASYFQNVSFGSQDSVIDYEAFINNAIQRYEATIASASTVALTSGTTNTRTYYISPDGRGKAFVEQRDGKTDLYMIDAQGQEHRLTTTGIAQQSPAPHWDSTGNYLTVAFKTTGSSSLYAVGTGGTPPQKVADYFDDTAATYPY